MRPALLLAALLLATVPVAAQSTPVGKPEPGTITPEGRVQQSRRTTSGAPLGTFVAARIDREPLPATDRVLDADSTLYFIEFDRMVLTLRADRTFRAAVRYRRTLFANDARGRARTAPLQNMNVTGTYAVYGDEIRFTPDETRETRGLRMLAGTITNARELSVPFHYRNGTTQRNRTLVMQRNDNVL